MKFYNHELQAIHDFILNELSLSGKQNRMRMKFLKILKPKLSEFEEYHWELLKDHAKLDEHGTPISFEENGKRGFEIKDAAKFQEAYSEFLNENVIVEENEENQEILLTLKESLNNCQTLFYGEKAQLHEYLCEKFDDIY